MLNEKYVLELERKWFKYKIKRIGLIVGGLLLVVGIFVASLFTTINSTHRTDNQLISNKDERVEKCVENKILQEHDFNDPVEENDGVDIETSNELSDELLEDYDEAVVTIVEENNTTSKAIVDNLETKKPTVEEVKKTPVVELNTTIVKKDENLTTDSVVLNQDELYERVLIEKTKYKKAPSLSADLSFMKDLDKAIKAAKKKAKPRKKSTKKVQISKRDVKNPSSLKKKFFQTGNISYAVALSKYYYLKKSYESSIRWAIEANEIDRSDYRSWVYFAKSKFRQGKKKDAKTALSYYLKNYNSKTIKKLLRDMKKGKI